MATELQIREHLDTLRSLPMHLNALVNSIGSVQWPGERKKYHLPSGVVLSPERRAEIADRLNAVQAIVTGSNLSENACSKARLALLTSMQLGYPAAGSLEGPAVKARAAFYDEAVKDMPPWAIDAAIKRWARGDVPDLKMGQMNFNFAPAPAVLRAICKLELRPFEEQAARLRHIQNAVSADEAMGRKSPTSQAAE